MNNIVICGIGTEVGKTIVSSILVKALQADYWKPVQCGNLYSCDSSIVRSLSKISKENCHQEVYRLKKAVSPHLAAELEKKQINPENFSIPQTSGPLVIETAGGVLVPLEQNLLQIDLYKNWNCKWVQFLNII